LVLRISQLRKSFPGTGGDRLRVIDIESLSLGAGVQVGLRGGSGTGKTTLLHLIAGILRADSGLVEVAGHALGALSEARRDRVRAEHVGYVFQTFNLLQGYSALENVTQAMAFGRGVDAGRAVSLLERVGLGDRLRARPGQLSVGQQQRVAVARALANRPSLVLADEPTGSLDPEMGEAALALLRGVCSEVGAALLLVSHDPGVLGRFERVLDFSTLNRAQRAEAVK
jgi:putative ABC transport system ATP-binding protein